MPRSTTISIRSAISSPARFTNKSAPPRWPSGAPSRPNRRLGLRLLRPAQTTCRCSDKALLIALGEAGRWDLILRFLYQAAVRSERSAVRQGHRLLPLLAAGLRRGQELAAVVACAGRPDGRHNLLRARRHQSGSSPWSVSPAAVAHCSALLGLFFVVKAWSYALDRYLLLIRELVGNRAAVVGRQGGDEFVILLPGVNVEEAAWIAESLRGAFEARALAQQDRAAQCTVSGGTATELSGEAELRTLLRNADALCIEPRGPRDTFLCPRQDPMVTASQLRISSRRPSYRATSADMVAAPADKSGSGREGRPVVDPEGHRRAWRRLGDLEIPARQSEQKSPFAVLHSDQGRCARIRRQVCWRQSASRAFDLTSTSSACWSSQRCSFC